jgi:hypothetical protein
MNSGSKPKTDRQKYGADRARPAGQAPRGDSAAKIPPRSVIARLKEEFREWYGALSIEEIMGNPALIRSIERVERTFSAAGA